MQLTPIEIEVLNYFYSYVGEVNKPDLSMVNVTHREFTGVGFVTELQGISKLSVNTESEEFTWGKVGAKLNGCEDTGYLIFVKGSKVIAIEGYTYEEEWPKVIESIELYEQ